MPLAQLIAADIISTLRNSEVNLGDSESHTDGAGSPLPSHGNRIVSVLIPLAEEGKTDGIRAAVAPLISEPWWPVPHPMRYSPETIEAGAEDTGRIAIWDALKAIDAAIQA